MAEGPLERLDRRVAPRLRRRPDVVLLLTGVLFLGAGATRYQMLSDDARAPATGEAITVGPAPAAPDADSIQAGHVGPVQGADVASYVAARRELLEALAAAEPRVTTVAIASFDRYRHPRDVARLLDQPGLRGLAARYRLPVGDPFAEDRVPVLAPGRVVLGDDPAAALMAALRADGEAARDQAEELEGMMTTADDPQFADVFRRDRGRLLAAAAHAGDGSCECVFAVELHGPAAALQRLAERDGVRLVDIAPPERARGAVTFSALLPEDRIQVGGP